MIQSQLKKLKNSLRLGLMVLLTLGMFGSPEAFAIFQENTTNQVSFNSYKGEVIDENTNKPLIFASLTLNGTNISTVTNTEGEFLLKIPSNITEGKVMIAFLGYKTKEIPLSNFSTEKNKITLEESVTELAEVNVVVPRDAADLVRETLASKGQNYFSDPTLMTAFYRETIKKRRRNVSLSEAVVNIYKTPYSSNRRDAVQLYKARKSTDYSKLDTLALKLQGGPFNTLFVDVMKYPEYIFNESTFDKYLFSFDKSTTIDGRLIFVINFKQNPVYDEQLYKGKLFIDSQNKTLTSAIYQLHITDKDRAARLFVRKKPANAKVWPTEVAYRVDYREKDNKWYYSYSNVLLEFKINWDDKLFNSVYSMTAEMAITDWEKNVTGTFPKSKERIRSSIILSDEAIGFSDPDFWGEYNIIEPEKSIESAIRKIQRQLRRSGTKGGASTPTP